MKTGEVSPGSSYLWCVHFPLDFLHLALYNKNAHATICGVGCQASRPRGQRGLVVKAAHRVANRWAAFSISSPVAPIPPLDFALSNRLPHYHRAGQKSISFFILR